MAKEPTQNYLMWFDSETGGLNCKTADVLTFYACITDEDYKIIDELDLKLKPDGRLPNVEQQALDVNKIDMAKHLADPATITYSEAKKKLIAFLKKYHKKKGKYNNIKPAGQNVPFDINFTQEYILTKEEWDELFHYKNVDTSVIVDFLKDCGFFPKDLGSLGTIVEYLQLPKRNAHTAKDDTLMCLDVYKKILEIMKAKRDNAPQQDLIALLEQE
jgi:oligoribonuclease (3'-5' exoribonuclease)